MPRLVSSQRHRKRNAQKDSWKVRRPKESCQYVKSEPPTNSRKREPRGMSLIGMGRKKERNLASRFASAYSRQDFGTSARMGVRSGLSAASS